MSTRLSKISREHNISINAIVSFFQTHNIKIEANPNTKISNEQYDILRPSRNGQDHGGKHYCKAVGNGFLQNQRNKRDPF